MPTFIRFTFYLLTILLPSVFVTNTNELFEFPKFIILLLGTSAITIFWLLDSLSTRPSSPSSKHKNILLLKLTLLAFLVSQTLSTIFSIHPYTSFWGYYTRFHQGLLTTICYTILTFAYLKYMDKQSTQKLIKLSILTSFLISIYAILERFGIDKNFWVQDVVNRPFATLGQPNWLAAYLLPNIYFLLNFLLSPSSSARSSFLHHLFLFTLFSGFIVTKSRSAYLGLALTLPLFLTHSFFTTPSPKKQLLKHIFFIITSLVLAIAIFGTPWTQPFWKYLKTHQKISNHQSSQSTDTQLASGGTESGQIRQIVWQGALKLFRQHPLLGTGVETFAYTYYWTRPLAHNYTSEWDFLYNKAHNEYLNLLANSGLLGLLTYLAFPLVFFLIILKTPSSPLSTATAIATLSLLITHFFGFSVIPVAYLFYLLPAIALTATRSPAPSSSPQPWQILTFSLLFLPLAYLIINHLYLADVLYTKAKRAASAGQIGKALLLYPQAIHKRPRLGLYHAYYAETLSLLTATLASQKDTRYHQLVPQYRQLTLQQIDTTLRLNPYHLDYYKILARAYVNLTPLDSHFHASAAQLVDKARQLAPTDPKLAYNLGLIYSRMGDNQKAIQEMQTAISLKKDYPDPYYALTLLYEEENQLSLIPPLLKQAQTYLHPLPANLHPKITKYLQSSP